jgi:small-conductance mechanosensitive channel
MWRPHYDSAATESRRFVLDILREYAPVPEFADSTLDWLVALAITAAWFFALLVIRRLIRRYNARLKDRPHSSVMELLTATLSRTAVPFMLILSAEAGLVTLTPSGLITRMMRSAVMIALIWQVGIWSSAATGAFVERRKLQILDTDRATAGSLGIIGVIVRMVIWAIVVLLILENAGVNVSALMAGLGIGGVAVALATQNILGDLFASLSITFDQPFVIGDLLEIENYTGRVEHIGLKSTRLRSPAGEQIIVSNTDLLRSRLRNHGRLPERRVQFTLCVAYETPSETLERIPSIISDIITSQADTRLERCHFATHGSWSLDFETVYHVLSPDLKRHMDIQQTIQIGIHREFARAGIEFANPPTLPLEAR